MIIYRTESGSQYGIKIVDGERYISKIPGEHEVYRLVGSFDYNRVKLKINDTGQLCLDGKVLPPESRLEIILDIIDYEPKIGNKLVLQKRRFEGDTESNFLMITSAVKAIFLD